MTIETKRECGIESKNFRQSDARWLAFLQQGTQNRAAKTYLTSENCAFDTGPSGYNHTLLCLQPPSTLSPGQKACRDITPFTYSGEILHSQNADPNEIPSQTRKFTGSLGTYNFTHAKAKSRRTQLYSPAQIIIIKKKSKTKPKGQPNTVWTSTFVWFTTAANLEDIKKNNNKTSRS